MNLAFSTHLRWVHQDHTNEPPFTVRLATLVTFTYNFRVRDNVFEDIKKYCVKNKQGIQTIEIRKALENWPTANYMENIPE